MTFLFESVYVPRAPSVSAFEPAARFKHPWHAKTVPAISLLSTHISRESAFAETETTCQSFTVSACPDKKPSLLPAAACTSPSMSTKRPKPEAAGGDDRSLSLRGQPDEHCRPLLAAAAAAPEGHTLLPAVALQSGRIAITTVTALPLRTESPTKTFWTPSNPTTPSAVTVGRAPAYDGAVNTRPPTRDRQELTKAGVE